MMNPTRRDFERGCDFAEVMGWAVADAEEGRMVDAARRARISRSWRPTEVIERPPAGRLTLLTIII
jgi:hypothetical protein